MHSWVCPKWAFSFKTRSYSVRNDMLGLPSQISEVSVEGMQTRFPSGTRISGTNGDDKRITRLLTPVYVVLSTRYLETSYPAMTEIP